MMTFSCALKTRVSEALGSQASLRLILIFYSSNRCYLTLLYVKVNHFVKIAVTLSVSSVCYDSVIIFVEKRCKLLCICSIQPLLLIVYGDSLHTVEKINLAYHVVQTVISIKKAQRNSQQHFK